MLPKDEHADGREFDALYSLVKEMLRCRARAAGRASLLMLGDQVYADEVSPETLAFIRKRRDIRKPPGEEVADFEEYTRLYRESWEDPEIRWLLSTVSVSMVVDDHDIHDDWNISAAWVEDMRELDWWAERESAGIATYWLYQYIGNLSPELLRESELLAGVRAADDGWDVLREFAANERGCATAPAGATAATSARTRLIVLDSRMRAGARRGASARCSTRRSGSGSRSTCDGDFDHLLIGTSDPLVLAPALHHAERWGEAVARGAWGERGRGLGREAAPGRRLRPLGRVRRVVRAADRICSRGPAPGEFGDAAGVDHDALRRRPPRLSRRARLPALGGGPQPRLAGGLLAVSQRARRPRAEDDRARRHARAASRLPRRSRGSPASAAERGPLAPGRGAVLRQPGRDAEDSTAARPS